MDILSPGEKGPSIAEQFGAVPPFGARTGTIKAVSNKEVVQHIGQGRHVVWNRATLHGDPLSVGIDATISKDGQVRTANLNRESRGR